MHSLGTLLEDHLIISYACFWLFFSVYFYIYFYFGFVVSFELRKCKASGFFPLFVFQSSFDYSGCFMVHMNFREVLSIFAKKMTLTSSYRLFLIKHFLKHGYFKILSLSIHEYRCLSIYLCVFTLLSMFYRFQCTSLSPP